MKSEKTRASAYDTLCESVEAGGGKIRLGRQGDAFMLVVDGPSEATPSAAAYLFTDISQLNTHALLILRWLDREQSDA